MKTIKLELSVKILLGAIALGLFLNVFKDFPPSAKAFDHIQKVQICNEVGQCSDVLKYNDINSLPIFDMARTKLN